jgi:hypothetical protein
VVKEIALIQQDDYRLNQLQKNIIDPLNVLFRSVDFLDGRYLDIEFKTTTLQQSIGHRLGRKYQGFFISNINANSNIWVWTGLPTDIEEDKSLFIRLQASAPSIVRLWVF